MLSPGRAFGRLRAPLMSQAAAPRLGNSPNVCCISNKKKESASLKRVSARRYSAFVSVAIVPFLFRTSRCLQTALTACGEKTQTPVTLRIVFLSRTQRADVILRVSIVRSIGLSVGSNNSLEKGWHYFSIPLGVHSNQTPEKKQTSA